MNENIDAPVIEHDIQAIQKYKWIAPKRTFPTIAICSTTGYFNIACETLLHEGYYNVYASSDYIVVLPATERERHSLKISHRYDRGYVICTTGFMQAFSVSQGIYKVYKYKNGIAFKRKEPLEVRS